MAKAPITSSEYGHDKNCARAYREFCRKSALKTVTARAKKELIKDYYRSIRPDDSASESLDSEATFDDLITCLQLGYDVYGSLGIEASDIRECLFQHLAKEIMRVDYDIIYYTWLAH